MSIRVRLPRRDWAALSVGVLQIDTAAQDRLRLIGRLRAGPEYSAPQIAGAVKSGAVTPAWSADCKSFEYAFDGKRYRYDVAARQATPIGEGRRRRRARPGRARTGARRSAGTPVPISRFA